jgi:hypothetical protein
MDYIKSDKLSYNDVQRLVKAHNRDIKKQNMANKRAQSRVRRGRRHR